MIAWLKQLRIHHWSKNALIFVPLAASHRLLEPELLTQTALAFLAFSLCASSIYVINDLRDLTADRAHPIKRFRPLAAGLVGEWAGRAMAVTALAAGLGLAYVCSPPEVLGLIALYTVLSLSYSQVIKRLPIWDVVCLSSLYLLRLYVGTAASGVTISRWLQGFSVFLFLSLALAKRVGELKLTEHARGYEPGDLPVLISAGVSAGLLSIVVLTLYVGSPEVGALYAHPERLWWLGTLVLAWVLRLWLRTARGWLRDDPLVATLRDPVAWAVGVAGTAVVWWAT